MKNKKYYLDETNNILSIKGAGSFYRLPKNEFKKLGEKYEYYKLVIDTFLYWKVAKLTNKKERESEYWFCANLNYHKK